MSGIIRSIILTVLVLFIFVLSVSSQILSGQAVTYASFNNIYDIGSSISHVYFVTSDGIIRYNKMEQRWEDPMTGQEGLNGETVQKIWVERFGQEIYIQTELSYYEYEEFFNRWSVIYELPDIDIYYSHVNAPSNLIPIFDANPIHDDEFIDNFGRSILAVEIINDNTGDLWIGTRGFGAVKAHAPSGETEMLPFGLLQNRVNAFCIDDTLIWLGGAVDNNFRTGITGFNPEQNSFSYIESGLKPAFPADDINCLAVDDKNLYAGTPSGLFILEKETSFIDGPINRSHGLIGDNILSLQQDSLGLYIGTNQGLDLLDIVLDSVYHIRPDIFAGKNIYDLEIIKSTLWIASSVGAFRYTSSTKRLQQYQDPELVLFSVVYDISVFDDYIWFSSDGGVVRLDLQSGESWVFRDYSARRDSRALAANDIVALVASNLGMTMIFHSDEKPFSRDFTTDDGLPSNSIYTLFLDGDYVWIGSDKGLTRFWWNNPNRVD